MSELADRASRRLVEARLDLNLFVEAGAGSGKTESLARRMAAGIVSGRYSVQEMAAVTFTRKAAAELRGRFQKVLEQRLPAATGETRQRIETALASLDHLFAGTIHSFCAHLLRERPVEAGIAPGFSELEEDDNEAFQQQAWRDYLSMLRGTGSPLLAQLQQAGVGAKDLDRAFEIVCTFDEVEFASDLVPMPDARARWDEVKAFEKALKAIMPSPPNPDAKCETLRKARNFVRLLRVAAPDRPGTLAAALAVWDGDIDPTPKWWIEGRKQGQELKPKLVALISNFRDATVVPFLTGWRAYLYGLATTVLTDARRFARDERRRALALNFTDLLVSAARLLRDNAAVRHAMQRKYRWLLVDEFQDTDPIQADVMLLLAADEHVDSPIADPYALSMRPGALFVVGDPKQSIYRFRRADIDVYNRVRGVIDRNGGNVVSLTTSFRARPALCEWNNGAFGRLLPAKGTPHQAGFSPLEPDPDWKPTGRSARGERGLRRLTVPSQVEKKDLQVWEAGAIARYIKAEVSAGRAAWSDFLVLTRKKRKRLTAYAEALRALDIPVDIPGDGAFGQSPHVGAVIKLLRVLGDPADAVALVGVLRGPLFGISDRELFEHRQAGGYFSIPFAPRAQGAGEDDKGARTKVEEALEQIGAFLRLTRSLPLPAAEERILDDTGVVALAAASAPNAEPAAGVLQIVDLVREVSERGGTLALAAEALEDAAESERAQSTALKPGRRDVVRVMNLHKAKGLEARVVFLADPFGGPRSHDVRVRIVRDGSVARGYLAIRRDINEFASEVVAVPAGWEKHQEAEAAYVLAEETRLLYVAATRARELLVVSGWAGASKDTRRPWAALEPFLAEATELDVPPQPATTSKANTDVSARTRQKASEQRARQFERAKAASWDVTSMTGGEKAREREGQDEARGAVPPADAGEGRDATAATASSERGGDRVPPADAEDGGDATADTAPPGRGGDPVRRADAGAGWGSLVHGLLEHAGRHPDASRDEFERLAKWLVFESPELVPVVPQAVDLVMQIVSAPWWREVVARGGVRAEVPFAVRIGPGESLGTVAAGSVPTLLQGVIDLVHRTDGGWGILDYKTDLADEAAGLLARHGAQVRTYRAAWERATGEKVTSLGIAAVRAGRVVEVV